jgi:hypothetical protein
MDMRNPNDGFDAIGKRIGATGRPVAGGDTREHGQPLTVGEWSGLIDESVNGPNDDAIWSVAIANLPATPICGAI